MNAVHRVVKNTLVLLFSRIISYLLNFLFIMYTARYLGAEGFGTLSFALAFTGIFAVFADLGLNILTVREIARNKSLARKYLGNIAIMKLILILITFGLIAFIINLLGYPKQTIKVVYLIALSVIFTSFSQMFYSIFQAYEKMEYQSIGQILNSVSLLSGGIFAIKQGFSIIGFAFIYFITSAIVLVYSFTVCILKFAKLKTEIDWSFWKSTIKEALPFGLASIFVTIYYWVDSVMLSLMKGNEVVGWYNAAYRLVYSLLIIPSAYFLSIYPIMSRHYKTSMSSLSNEYERSIRYMGIIAIPIGIGVTWLAKELILMIYGEEFSPSIVALQILIWAVVFSYMSHAPTYTLYSVNNQKVYTKVVFFCLILNFTLNFIFIPKMSYIGASLTTLATEFIAFLSLFVYVKKYIFNIQNFFKVGIKLLFSAIITESFIYFVGKILGIIISVITGIIMYFCLLWMLKIYSREDISMLKNLIKVNTEDFFKRRSCKKLDSVDELKEITFTGERVIPKITPYDIYQEHIARYVFTSRFIKNKVVLDVACGTGYGTFFLSKSGVEKIIGIDISEDAIKYALTRYKGGNIEFIVGNATSLPFPDEFFDVVVSFETIEHISEYEKFLIECKRVLKNNGIFICSTPNKKVSSPNTIKPLNPFHVKEFFPEEFEEILSRNFEDIRLYGQHNIFLIKKRIAGIIGKIILKIPKGETIKNMLKEFIISNRELVKEIEELNSSGIISKKYMVSKFKDNNFISSSYIVAVAKKRNRKE